MSQEGTHCAVMGSWWVVGRAGTQRWGVLVCGKYQPSPPPPCPSRSPPSPLQVPARLLEMDPSS